MRVIALLVMAYIFFLSGCAKKSDNLYKEIEEKDVNETFTFQREEETTDADNEYSIDKELVEDFIDDSHFYDNVEGVDFAENSVLEKEEKYHVKILNAYISDNLEDFGDYYAKENIKGELEEAKKYCEKKGYEEDDLTYLCVQMEIINNSNGQSVLCMSPSFGWIARIDDIRGQEFGLADMRIKSAMPYGELWYDSTKKENEGNQYYFLHLQAGEKEVTNCVYIFSKKLLGTDLYFRLHIDDGEYSSKYHCIFPPTAKTTKFLKINIKENNIN